MPNVNKRRTRDRFNIAVRITKRNKDSDQNELLPKSKLDKASSSCRDVIPYSDRSSCRNTERRSNGHLRCGMPTKKRGSGIVSHQSALSMVTPPPQRKGYANAKVDGWWPETITRT